ncbi:hypothetical protein THAOC_23559 [Thalassiosira oceanica]|uniref:Uncharacterized protein n=1 Tax=Thalassiosira oceanica TaxID=159749 RepID=K0S6K9_THAOC|nr:hypothetical protein THAOC_23559 [Thalassiosira oceanica]|eukprot:EJK56536.1 hypothetical protein THAOC_23559 [Thalassiosira oceanica]
MAAPSISEGSRGLHKATVHGHEDCGCQQPNGPQAPTPTHQTFGSIDRVGGCGAVAFSQYDPELDEGVAFVFDCQGRTGTGGTAPASAPALSQGCRQVGAWTETKSLVSWARKTAAFPSPQSNTILTQGAFGTDEPDWYEECLAGKTLIFIGDSRVRYQFMHLARFLVHGRSIRCRDFDSPATEQSTGGKVSTDDEGCKVIDHDLRTTTGYGKDWNDWYKSSTDLLKKKGEQDNESGLPAKLQDLVHIGEDFPPFAPFTLPSDKTSRCAPGECRKGNRVDAFNGDLNQTMWSILPLLNATHAFVNVGWAELEEPIDNLKVNSDLSCKILDFEASYPDIDVTLESHSSSGVCSTSEMQVSAPTPTEWSAPPEY